MSHSVCINNKASTYRGLHTDSSNQSIINLSNITTTQAKPYATVTMNNSFPTKEQAILIDAIDNTTMKDYMLSLKSLAPKLFDSLPESLTVVSASISIERLQHKTL